MPNNLNSFLNIINQGLQLADQKSQSLQAASRPMSNKVVERARQVLADFVSPGMTDQPMQPEAPMMPSFADGGKVDIGEIMGAIYGSNPDAVYKVLMGNTMSGANTSDIQNYQSKLRGYGLDINQVNGAFGPGGNYPGANNQDVGNKLAVLSKLLSSGDFGSSGGGTNTASGYGGGAQPQTDAYGRPLSSIKKGDTTALGYPGDYMTYGYGPEFNFMYKGGDDAFNPQVQNANKIPQGYGYNFIPDYYSVYGYADGGPVSDGMEDYTPAPNLDELRQEFIRAVHSGDMEGASQLEEFIQQRQLMEGKKVETPVMPWEGKQTPADDTIDSLPPTMRKAMGGTVKDMRGGGKSKGPGTTTSDSIPAMLSNNEYVIPAWAVKKAGKGSHDDGHAFFDNLLSGLKNK